MRLGGGHTSSTLSHAAEWAAEAEVEVPNPWGNDLMNVNADQDDWSEMTFFPHATVQMLTSYSGAFETAPVLGHETYVEQSVKAPSPVRAEGKPRDRHNRSVRMKPLTATQRRAIVSPKQATPSRSPAATPPISQQGTANTTQSSLVGMTKEEKTAEMNRRKEERKQVSGDQFTKSVLPTDNTITAYRSTQGTESFRWETMKQISRSVCGRLFP